VPTRGAPRIAGERMYLWRAVDHGGEVLDMLVQRRRDTRWCPVMGIPTAIFEDQGSLNSTLGTRFRFAAATRATGSGRKQFHAEAGRSPRAIEHYSSISVFPSKGHRRPSNIGEKTRRRTSRGPGVRISFSPRASPSHHQSVLEERGSTS
jgi:DDE domain